jgi:hypothetical protein
MIAYHGTPYTQDIDIFKGRSFPGWFTSDPKFAGNFASGKGQVIKVQLDIKNPVNIPDMASLFVNVVDEVARSLGVTRREIQMIASDAASIAAENSDGRLESLRYLSELFNSPQMVELVKSRGFDTILATEDGTPIIIITDSSQVVKSTKIASSQDELLAYLKNKESQGESPGEEIEKIAEMLTVIQPGTTGMLDS